MRLSELPSRFPGAVWESGFSFARHTSIGCGGRAALAASPLGREELEALLALLLREGVPHCYLGAGANVLPADGLFEGVVVRFSRLNALGAEGDLLFSGAGTTGGALCRYARLHGLGGFEPFTGIPMTVGGGAAMNAGVPGGHFSDVVVRVFGVEKGKLRVFEGQDLAYKEKSSVFLEQKIAIAGVVLRGQPRSLSEIEANTARFRAKRVHLPKGRSMGCAFVNPPGVTAGALIERCGLKGKRVGGARVSEAHANFLLNEGGSAEDVAALCELVKAEVYARTGIALREEFRRIP